MARVPRTPEGRPDLRERFADLFAQLAREEDALKSVMSKNELMERQLRQSPTRLSPQRSPLPLHSRCSSGSRNALAPPRRHPRPSQKR